MASDPFDELLDIENDYYKEGYDAGVTDSTYAGLVEGKVFGIEKGYEKAVELGKHRGRALVWQHRLGLSNPSDKVHQEVTASSSGNSSASTLSDADMMRHLGQILPHLPTNARLQRHVEVLSVAADPTSVAKDNSDEAVTDFDERIAKASAKAKVIANIIGEAFNPASTGNTGIEDSTGLNARQ